MGRGPCCPAASPAVWCVTDVRRAGIVARGTGAAATAEFRFPASGAEEQRNANDKLRTQNAGKNHHSRLRVAVHAAHRAACARAERLLRDPPLQPDSGDRLVGAGRDSFGQPLLGARCPGPDARSFGDQGQAAAAGRLLRRAVPCARLRRRGAARSQPRVRPCDAHRGRRAGPADARSSGDDAGVDVARRHDHARSRRVRDRRFDGGRPRGGLPDRRRADMGHSVPPRGLSLDRRQTVAEEFRRRHLRMRAVVDFGELRGVHRTRTARETGRRPRGAGPFGRRRFDGGRRAAAPGHRPQPLLHLRRFGPAAQERVRRACSNPTGTWA